MLRREKTCAMRQAVAAAALAFLALGNASADDSYLVISVKSVEKLLSDVRRITGGEKSKDASPIDGVILQLTGGKGLAGVDRSKPFGACVDPGSAGTPELTLLVPVKDSKAFLGILGIPPEAAANAEGRTFHVSAFGRELYTKTSKGYSYFSTGAGQLEKLPNPASLAASRYDIGLTLNFSRLTNEQRRSMATTLATSLGQASALAAATQGGSEAYLRGNQFGREMTSNNIEQVILEAERFSFGVNLDESSGVVAVDWELTARPGTPLAASLNSYASKTPSFAGLFSSDAAASVVWTAPIPDQLRKAFGAEMAINAKQAHDELNTSHVYATAADRQNAHESMDSFFSAFDGLDTLDTAFVLDPAPGGKLQLLAAFRVSRGQDIQATVEKLAKFPSGAFDGGELKLDVAKHPSARIHSLRLSKEGAEILAGGVLYIAVRGDAVFLAAGGDGLTLIRSALDKTSGPPPQRPPISVRVRPSKLLDLFAGRGTNARVDCARQAFLGGGDYATVEMLPVRDGVKGRVTLGEGFLKLAQSQLNAAGMAPSTK